MDISITAEELRVHGYIRIAIIGDNEIYAMKANKENRFYYYLVDQNGKARHSEAKVIDSETTLVASMCKSVFS